MGELELKTTEQKIAKGDEEEQLKLKENKKRRDSVGAKIYNLVEVEVNDLYEKFEDLFVATLSNTVSMAWRDACRATALLMTTSHSASVTLYFFYSVLFTMFGLYVVIRIGQVLDREEKK